MRLPFTQMQMAVGAGALVALVLLLLLVVLIRRSRAKAKRRARTEAALAEPTPMHSTSARPPAELTEAEAAWFAAGQPADAPSPLLPGHHDTQSSAQPGHPIEYIPTEPIPTSQPTAVGLAPEPSAEQEQNRAAPSVPVGNGNGHGNNVPNGHGAPREGVAMTAASPKPGQTAPAEPASARQAPADDPERGIQLARIADAKDRLLQVLLIDPDRALHALKDLEECRNQLEQLNEVLDQQLRLLADAARRLRGAGLTPAQVARLAGCGEGELASLLAEHAPSPSPRPHAGDSSAAT